MKDRALVLTPGLGDKIQFVRTEARIKLIRPDKSEIHTRITGISFEGNHDILVPGITKEDVPIGTEVWTL